jgi:hypothetical protein
MSILALAQAQLGLTLQTILSGYARPPAPPTAQAQVHFRVGSPVKHVPKSAPQAQFCPLLDVAAPGAPRSWPFRVVIAAL